MDEIQEKKNGSLEKMLKINNDNKYILTGMHKSFTLSYAEKTSDDGLILCKLNTSMDDLFHFSGENEKVKRECGENPQQPSLLYG